MTPARQRGKPFAVNVLFVQVADWGRRLPTPPLAIRTVMIGFYHTMQDSSSTSLFPEMGDSADRNARSKTAAPLAERMRPRTLSDFVGQEQLVGEGRVLRRLIEGGGTMPSLILWGPPGTGKTTLARLLAEKTNARFIALSAVFSGVKELRAAIGEARLNRQRGHRTILFIDEIHRFNKAQQDALLPAVEDGTVVLIGATTENPSFEVISALLSRARVLVLNPLDESEIERIIRRAISDEERGVAIFAPVVSDELIARLAHMSGGDARVALAALEAAVAAAEPDEQGHRTITDDILTESFGRAQFAYDKGGEQHYNLASALIKSLRNSDVNASLYWLARMIEGGADPVFIVRRLCILASEDIGMADPQAMVQAAAAAEIVQLIGMPEGLFPLTQATIYLARAPKSNVVLRAYSAAHKDAAETSREPVPLHLRNAPTPLMKHLGYGREYRYVHSDAGAKDEMSCLPDKLKARVYYEEEESGVGSQEPD
jgi:putative ATPase